MFAVFTGNHPVDLAPRRRLNEKWINAAAMVASNHRPLIIRQRQFIHPPRPPQQLAEQVGSDPQQALKWTHSAARKCLTYNNEWRDCQEEEKNGGRGFTSCQASAFTMKDQVQFPF